jgi:hypothetical protein
VHTSRPTLLRRQVDVFRSCPEQRCVSSLNAFDDLRNLRPLAFDHCSMQPMEGVLQARSDDIYKMKELVIL